MGLADRDYMQYDPEHEPEPPRPRWGIIIVALIIIASFLAAIF